MLRQQAQAGSQGARPVSLDLVFHALADPTRRGLVERLSQRPASVSELAAPLPISLPAVVQHLQVLEASGLIQSNKVGRVRTCSIEPAALQGVERWIAARKASWEARFDRLGAFLSESEGASAAATGAASAAATGAASAAATGAASDSAVVPPRRKKRRPLQR